MSLGNGHILCIPGQRICEALENYIAGDGTYIFNRHIYASQPGHVSTVKDGDYSYVKVILGKHSSVVPDVGSIVTCRVLAVNSKQAIASILAVGSSVLQTPFQGTVKKQDVREHMIDMVSMAHFVLLVLPQKDYVLGSGWTPPQALAHAVKIDRRKVDMYNSFHPGDLILAQVISLGGTRNYELSTAGNEFGVVTAHCCEGHVLIPTSWTTMRCQCKTELRKVAKVAPPK